MSSKLLTIELLISVINFVFSTDVKLDILLKILLFQDYQHIIL